MKKSNTTFVVKIFFFSCIMYSLNTYSQVIQSDDFNSASLNTAIWTFINPLNDASYTMTGYNSGNASIDISVPSTAGHDIWTNGVEVPRIMQAAADSDFEIEIKFESIINIGYQQQGIIIEDEPGHVIRYEMYSDGTKVVAFAAIINNPGGVTSPTVYANKNLGTPSPPYFLRVKRVSNDWYLTYSFDGNVWSNALIAGTSFNYAMNVTAVGVYAGNSPSTEHTAVVDYFFNTDNPIIPEDSDIPKVTITPQLQSVYTDLPISLQVKVEGISGLFASSVTLEFDETIFKYSNITEGSFLENNGSGYDVLYKSLPEDNTLTDFVTVDEAILGRDDVSGTGALFIIDLIPLRAGIGKIKVKSFELRDKDNNTIDANVDSAEISISSPAPNAKIFLEGAYQSGVMTSLLPELGLLPLTQPFDTAPWNYTGFEKVDTDFYTDHPEIVDWVLIELRSDENTKVAERAAFINESGSLVDIDGINPVSFFVNSSLQYYIVIRHRNHLDVMSSSLADVNYASTLYDFTTASANAYGTDALKEVDTGVFAMYVGDGNNDNLINGSDFNVFNPLFRSGSSGYLTVDWNLDGNITGTDFNIFNPNFRTGQISQVP